VAAVQEPTKCVEKNIFQNGSTGCGTNIEEALRLARALAKRQHTEGAQDRVVLITDGVANLGNTIPEELSKQIVAMRQEGIAFDVSGFAKQLAGALTPAAKNVKVQVKFNPRHFHSTRKFGVLVLGARGCSECGMG